MFRALKSCGPLNAGFYAPKSSETIHFSHISLPVVSITALKTLIVQRKEAIAVPDVSPEQIPQGNGTI